MLLLPVAVIWCVTLPHPPGCRLAVQIIPRALQLSLSVTRHLSHVTPCHASVPVQVLLLKQREILLLPAPTECWEDHLEVRSGNGERAAQVRQERKGLSGLKIHIRTLLAVDWCVSQHGLDLPLKSGQLSLTYS